MSKGPGDDSQEEPSAGPKAKLEDEPRPSPGRPTATLPGSIIDSMGFRAGSAPSASSDGWTPPPFPVNQWERYEFIRPLGQGSMGAVFMAHDRHLDRIVALKFIRGADHRQVIRLEQEARVQARIDHPNICKVFEVGQVEDKPYIAMQFIQGRPLDQARADLSLADKVMVIRDAALAMHEAHRVGIIHRDLKPSNIMVDRNPDGRFVPVVMDFGLARAIGLNQGLTESGAVMGTPAYMSPEQARGEIRNLDRRTDVYGLGATLYDLLTEQPPFVGETVTVVLLSTLAEEPPAVRAINSDLPVDLETITMKCLNKEPGQRYDSARALAEDLDRYLNGEPIEGRRTSLFHRLRRLARRNKAVVTVGAVSLLGLVGLSAYGIKARFAVQEEKAQAAARSVLSHELGQDVKEMEWFIRSVHQLPVHQTTYANRLLMARIERLAALRHGLGDAGEGMIQYAQGQGYLSLQQFDRAYQHLTLAQRNGNNTAELLWTLGQVLGELYAKKLQEVLRSGDANFVEARRKKLEEEYLKPAVRALQGSQGLKLGSPHFLEGLIALYSKQYDRALQKAKEALGEAPWMYEAKKLVGDVYFAQAVDQMNLLDFGTATSSFNQAIKNYQEAAEIGRSDPLLYEQMAESYLLLAELDVRQREISARPILESAISHCDTAITISPDRATCYSKKARAYAWLTMTDSRLAKNPTESFQKLSRAASEAIRLEPEDAYAYDALGRGQLWFAWYEEERGIDPISHYNSASDNFDIALKKISWFPFCLNNSAILHIGKAQYLWSKKGVIDPTELDKATTILNKAIELDPKYVATCPNMLSVHRFRAQFAVFAGQDPSISIRDMDAQGKKCLAQTENSSIYVKMILGYSNFIDYLLWQHKEVAIGEIIDKERGLLDRLIELSSISSHKTLASGLYAVAAARSLVLRHQDPTATIEAGRRALAVHVDAPSQRAWCQKLEASLALSAADWALQKGQPVLPHLEQAVAAARQAVATWGDSYDNHGELSRSLLRLAEARLPQASPELIEEGLRSATAALLHNLSFSEAHALRGGHYLLKARLPLAKPERLAAAQQAQESFAQAVKMNAVLKDVYADRLHQADLLVTALSAH